MALRIELEPFEKIFIGGSVLTNYNARVSFLLEGNSPVLRYRDSIKAEAADTPIKRIYHCIQTMYLESNIKKYESVYADLTNQLLSDKPMLRERIDAATALICRGDLYKALKEIKKVMLDRADMTATAA